MHIAEAMLVALRLREPSAAAVRRAAEANAAPLEDEAGGPKAQLGLQIPDSERAQVWSDFQELLNSFLADALAQTAPATVGIIKHLLRCAVVRPCDAGCDGRGHDTTSWCRRSGTWSTPPSRRTEPWT